MTRSTKLLSDARSHATSRLLYAYRSNRFRDRMDWTDMFHVFQTGRVEQRTSSSPSRSEIRRSRSISGLSVWSDLAADMEVGQTTLDEYDNDSIVDKVLKFFISGNVAYKMNHLHVNEQKCMLQTLSTSHESSHEPSRV